MSDFAKAQLLKYGWTEGKGLGKNENGITEAIRPKLKFDTTGIGHKDVDFQWWDCVYDKALKNIVLDKKSDGVSIDVAKQDAFNISSTESKLQIKHQKHPLRHGKFLQTSTLLNGNTIRNSKCEFVDENPEDYQGVSKMSDEELFKACGGRTAHKGARHGLKLSGKLARVAEQEKQLLNQFLKNNGQQQNENKCKKKKKKKREKLKVKEEDPQKHVNEHAPSDDDSPPSILTQQVEIDCRIPKKSRRKVKRKIQDLSRQLNESCMILGDTGQDDEASPKTDSHRMKQKEKKSKRKREEVMEMKNSTLDEPNNLVQKAKKRRKHSPILVVDSDSGRCLVNSPELKRLEKDTFLLGKESEAQWLNNKIKLKSIKKLERKEKRKIQKISDDLLAVNLHHKSPEQKT